MFERLLEEGTLVFPSYMRKREKGLGTVWSDAWLRFVDLEFAKLKRLEMSRGDRVNELMAQFRRYHDS
jgi:hypothetical protein